MENEIYDNAELALAAYADLNKGQSTGSDDNLQALKNAGMICSSLANNRRTIYRSRYGVISHCIS